MVGHTFEYNAAVWKLKEIVDSGELGAILYIDTARLSLGRYQHDCNVIWDLAPHDISIVIFLLGEFPDRLGCGHSATSAPCTPMSPTSDWTSPRASARLSSM